MNPWIAAILAGGMGPLSFSPLSWTFLLPVSVGTLILLCTRAATGREAALLSFCHAFSWGLVGLSWVYISIHHYGHLPAIPSAILTALLLLVIALIHAPVGWIMWSLAKIAPNALSAAGIGAAWVLGETFQATLFSGFPWLQFSHALIDSPLAAWIPILGSAGLAWFIISVGWWLFERFNAGASRAALIGVCTLVLSTALVGQWSWTQALPKHRETTVTLLQGNIPQSERWVEVVGNTQSYLDAIIATPNSDWIVLPEGAIEIPWPVSYSLLSEVDALTRERQQSLLMGMPIERNMSYTNAIVGFGLASGRYEKQHLVPFGEYVPGPPLVRRFIQDLNIPMSNFRPGLEQNLIQTPTATVLPMICYEVAFPHLWQPHLAEASVLVSVVNNAWFGHSWAAHQQWQMLRFYAKASGRPVLQASNSGVTGVINSDGEVIADLPWFVSDQLTARVRPRTGLTPWGIWGEFPFQLLSGCLLAVIALAHVPFRKRDHIYEV